MGVRPGWGLGPLSEILSNSHVGCNDVLIAKKQESIVCILCIHLPEVRSWDITGTYQMGMYAIYLEGGPETSLYVCVGETVIEKLGSYVSDTYPTDANQTFWRLPNVIGIKAKP